MQKVNTSQLFSPFHIKHLTLKNRFIVPSMQRGMCVDGTPTSQMRDYLSERAQHGFALIMGESTAIDHPAATHQIPAAHMTQKSQPAWREVIRGVHDAGGKMFIQLWHEGAARKSQPSEAGTPQETISPSGLLKAGVENGRAATTEDLDDLKRAYVRSAKLAKEAGADGVEIHAAHGYLLDQFLWHETNQRTDEYGGPNFSNRLRFPCEVIKAVREALGKEFVISFRFSQWKEADFDGKVLKSPVDLKVLIDAITEAGVDLINVSTRRFYLPEWPNSPLNLAGWAKTFTDLPVITVGGVGLDSEFRDILTGAESHSTAEQSIEQLAFKLSNNEFDLVAIGRASIADPQWVEKASQGKFDEIRHWDKEIIESFAADVQWDGWVFDA